ncbi:hypothetical protein D0869_07883 [Hortaea werneckii]|uniref:Sulfhydryl oxidase n=1 Tax=Hortaea werneckii TaxID=91943 RepID=A0A3M6WN17_HORWE|nr:hypothetical protein D0869_07883 [Hortaea werneckii]RMY11270.1 hypothetical protein D0868_03236 [Hortaea werneckii]RMY18706.1 hypothetical protein D0867_05147 [Hortaea werneckii]RMY28998.1 hypothetical protein D0866_09017 [Hortaea werneckii]
MPSPSRRNIFLLFALALVAGIIYVSTSSSNTPSTADLRQALTPSTKSSTSLAQTQNVADVDEATLSGHTIMPKLGNATAKAELGRSAWKLFHTIMARYPDAPSKDEQTALKSYIHLFVRLYPCGECAEHFHQIVDKFPPQVSSRSAAAAWACHVHNEVNKSLGKELFDCSNIGDFYDCGCAEDEKEGGEKSAEKQHADTNAEEIRSASSDTKPEMSRQRVEEITGERGRDFNADLLTHDDVAKLVNG